MARCRQPWFHTAVPPSPGRSRLPSANHRLRVFDSRPVLFVLALIAVATGATGVVVAGPGASPGVDDATMPPAEAVVALPSPVQPSTLSEQPSASPVAVDARPATPSPGPTPTPSPTPEPRSDPPEKLTGYVWPIRNARLSSRFGPRDDGFLLIDGERTHDGMDLATWCGDKVRAAHDGIVLYAGRKFDPFLGYSEPLTGFYARITNLGNFPLVVVIDDGNGYRSVYAHVSVAKVGAGDVVKAGQTIGLEGATGRASGCHLHYSLIRMDGAWQDVAPSLHSLYPPRVRERVDPFLVLPLDDPFAPSRVRARHGASPAPHEPPPPAAAGDD